MTTPHHVLPADEKRHAPEPDDLWGESYYCDFVADGGFGGWLRLGLYPNRQVAWWTTWIVRPGHAGVCAVDYRAPVPPGDSLVSESAQTGRIEIDLRRPLEEFRLAARTPAFVFADPAEVYTHGEASGRPASLDLDLTWTTDGVPYGYDVTTRYEIPCLVAGTVAVDRETLRVDGQGQRDHSWGVRDWWQFGWCWCSVRLDDGTRIHLSDIRIPGMPVFFGYVQSPGAGDPAAHTVTSLSVSEQVGEHGFPSMARIELTAGLGAGGGAVHEIGLEVTPVAFGPVLLRNDSDGRASRFPRAMITCRTDEGVSGAGWIEWNQPEA